MGLPGESVAVVGDTPDDVAAARHVGASDPLPWRSHHEELLESEGVPVAETMAEAVEIALSRR